MLNIIGIFAGAVDEGVVAETALAAEETGLELEETPPDTRDDGEGEGGMHLRRFRSGEPAIDQRARVRPNWHSRWPILHMT